MAHSDDSTCSKRDVAADAIADATAHATSSTPDAKAHATRGADAKTSGTKAAAQSAENAQSVSARHVGHEQADAATGATPGVASACRDLDMTSPLDVSNRLGIKPPGVS